MKIYIFLVATLLLSGAFAACSVASTYTDKATCIAGTDSLGLPCCWWKMASGSVSAADKITATTGCALILAKNADASVLHTKNLSLACTLTSTTRTAIDTTKGFCFDWHTVNGSNGGVVLGNQSPTYGAGSSGQWAATEVFRTTTLYFDAQNICTKAVAGTVWWFGENDHAAPTTFVATGAGTGSGQGPAIDLIPHVSLQVLMAASSGCTCTNRAAYVASGVDTNCQSSYMGGTAGTYKAADCEKIADNSGASGQKCCSATFGTASTVLKADCAINSAVCAGLSYGNVYCFGKNAVMLLDYANNNANIAGYPPHEICKGAGTAQTAFSSIYPVAGTGTFIKGATSATTAAASGNVQCTSSCVVLSASTTTTTTTGTTTTATTAASGSFVFAVGVSFLAIFASLLK